MTKKELEAEHRIMLEALQTIANFGPDDVPEGYEGNYVCMFGCMRTEAKIVLDTISILHRWKNEVVKKNG